ncbi:CRISPR-associated protein Cas5 [Pseudomonas sp. O230]|uniref:CRISPR-associated protein Cas5 n=1 Tax=Pseudomonas sp. O230 TaxID=3159450 RepID=UPI00387B94C8
MISFTRPSRNQRAPSVPLPTLSYSSPAPAQTPGRTPTPPTQTDTPTPADQHPPHHAGPQIAQSRRPKRQTPETAHPRSNPTSPGPGRNGRE